MGLPNLLIATVYLYIYIYSSEILASKVATHWKTGKMLKSSVAKQKLPCGYDLRILGGTESVIDSKYLCTFCERILKNAVQSQCGHRFCSDCFQHCVESKWICSKCLEESEDKASSPVVTDQSFPDNAIRRELNSLSIKCCFDGCEWKGKFKEFESSHYASCRYKVQALTCPLCHEPIQQEDGKLTSSDDVPHAIICSMKRIKSLEEIIGYNSSETNRGRPLLMRLADIENVINTLQRNGQSPFSTDSSPRGERKFVRGPLGGGPNSLPAESLQIPPNFQPPQALGFYEKVVLFEGVITVLNREVEKLTRDVEALGKQQHLERDAMAAMERKMNIMERTLTMKEVTIAEMNKRMADMEETSFDGNLLWKISEFNQKREEASSGRMTSFYSPPFYTSKTGYKMCARIYLNGDGMGKGTHVSFFFVVMRGNYDALLKWPFRHKVTLMFIDQNNREHVTDAFRPDSTSSSFRRPTTEMNIASGCPMFMPLSRLTSPLNAYVKDNTAFVRIIVNIQEE